MKNAMQGVGLACGLFLGTCSIASAKSPRDMQFLDQVSVGSRLAIPQGLEIPVRTSSVEYSASIRLPEPDGMNVWGRCHLLMRHSAERTRKILAGTRLEVTRVEGRHYGQHGHVADVALWTGKSTAVMGLVCDATAFGYNPQGIRQYYEYITVEGAQRVLGSAIVLEQLAPEIVQ